LQEQRHFAQNIDNDMGHYYHYTIQINNKQSYFMAVRHYVSGCQITYVFSKFNDLR